MKFSYLFIALFLVSGCSWKHKEFTKILDSDDEVSDAPQVEASADILEKFEIQETVKTEEAPAATPAKKIELKPTKKAVAKNQTVDKKAANPAVAVTTAPAKYDPTKDKDYPKEYFDITKKAEETWKKYSPRHKVGSKTYLDIHYLGMTVGKIMFTNKGLKTIKGQEVWHFHARFKSAPFYSAIYELDDTVDTYVTKNNFLSVRYSLIQRESKQNVDDLQLFDRELLKSFWFYKMVRPDKTKVKNEERPIPAISTDPFSVVFFFQGLPLVNGEKYEIPLMNKGKVLILKAEVEGRETIETEIGKKKAIRLHAMTKYTGDHLKSGDMTFWFSDDDNRTLLRASAKIKIGSVTADVVEVQ